MNYYLGNIIFIFTFFISLTSGIKEKIEGVEPNNNCRYSCNNFIKLTVKNITIDAIKRIKVKTKFTYAESDINVSIMSRKKSWVVVERNFGDKPTSFGTKHLLPSKDEAIQWFRNKKCKIGILCPPNGDCWGSSSTACHSDTTHQWVEQREFQFKGLQWSTSFHDTCTMDWECNNIEKITPLHYDSDGKRFIVIDENKVYIKSQEPEQVFPFKSYTIYIDKMPKEYEITKTLLCFKHKKDLLCEEENGAFIMFEQGTKCTVLGNRKYCLLEGEFNKVRDFGAYKYASISDLNQVRDAFIVNQERENYNMYLIGLQIRKMSKFMLDLVSILSKNNPSILNNYLQGNFFARPLTNDVYEICPCKDEQTCEMKEFHHPSLKFCDKSIKSKTLSPFDLNESIDYVIDEKFKFQGKDIHVMDSIIEQEERNGDYEESQESVSIFSEITKGLNVFGFISDWLVYVAFVLSVFNFFRR